MQGETDFKLWPMIRRQGPELLIAAAPQYVDDGLGAGAGQPSVSAPLPWEDSQVREDVLKVYNLRLPEPYLLKLKHIAAHTPGSMHQFCIDVLLPAIDKKVKELA